ncbi:MAG: hypothetical protein ABIR69_01090 [Nitrospiraceae bacterium]
MLRVEDVGGVYPRGHGVVPAAAGGRARVPSRRASTDGDATGRPSTRGTAALAASALAATRRPYGPDVGGGVTATLLYRASRLLV